MSGSPRAAPGERVLVLMPTRRDAERTASWLSEAHIASHVCADLPDLCRELRAGAGAVLLTDEALASDSAGQLSEALRGQPAWSALPTLVLAREGWSRHGLTLATELSLVTVERPVRTRTLIGMVSSALRDRRRQYEIRDALLVREQQAAQLRAQEEKLRFALEAGGLGSWELNLETHEMDCSEICKATFGRAAAAPFTYQALRECIHPEDQARVAATIERCVRERADYDIEYRVLWPNGELHWVMVRGRATYDAAGRPRLMVGVSLDVTERKRMHEALQQSESELARQAEELRLADRRKDEFLATLAHELRNPLAPIRTGMDLLSGALDAGPARQTLGVMQRQIAHMVRLIDDLLDVSRITSGKMQIERQRVALGVVIDAALEASLPLIERKGHTLHVQVPERELVLDADLTRIAQVIGNLLNNACHYTPDGGVIELHAQRDGDAVVIDVRDNGFGIPQDRLADVFEMFSQVNRRLERSHGGLGIGLALVRRLVEMHGGTSSASSPGLDQGSTFTVRLPLAAGGVRAPAASHEAGASPGGTRRVLVVDDNRDAADMLAMVLAHAGYQTQTAYDSHSALATADAWLPDVVILDIGLPDINGYDVARELRRSERFEGLALIALTGWGSQGDKQRAMDAGFDVHLTKPVDARALTGVLARLEPRAT